jgi:hypothetical protein
MRVIVCLFRIFRRLSTASSAILLDIETSPQDASLRTPNETKHSFFAHYAHTLAHWTVIRSTAP